VFNLVTDVMTFSAFIALTLNRAGVNIWLTVPFAGLSGAIISFLINRGILQPMLRRGTGLFGMMITTIAISLIIWNGVLTIVRPGYFHYELPKEITYRFAGQILTATQLITIGIALIAIIIVNALLRYTKLGKSMRAVAENPDLARASGIPSRRVVDLTWIISGFLCGIAGVILCINLPVFSTVTARGLLIVILASVVLGGVGNPYGAILGALTLGISSE
jgi:branched-chain amino acid transport system permease protein/neutral amino acid transport system permease protein